MQGTRINQEQWGSTSRTRKLLRHHHAALWKGIQVGIIHYSCCSYTPPFSWSWCLFSVSIQILGYDSLLYLRRLHTKSCNALRCWCRLPQCHVLQGAGLVYGLRCLLNNSDTPHPIWHGIGDPKGNPLQLALHFYWQAWRCLVSSGKYELVAIKNSCHISTSWQASRDFHASQLVGQKPLKTRHPGFFMLSDEFTLIAK